MWSHCVSRMCLTTGLTFGEDVQPFILKSKLTQKPLRWNATKGGEHYFKPVRLMLLYKKTFTLHELRR